MADEPDKPAAPATKADTPAPARRKYVRKAASSAPDKPKAAAPAAAAKSAKAVKPRATKRAAAKTPTKRAAPRKPKSPSALAKATSKVGGTWGAAAIAGGVAAVAGAAALLTLRSSSSGKGVGTVKKPIDISSSGDLGEGHPQTVHGTAPAQKD